METSGQIRAARALLNWSAADLAKAAGVSIRTIQRWEDDANRAMLPAIVAQIRAALEQQGLEFVSQNGKLGVIAPVKPRAVAHASPPPEIAPPSTIADPRAQLASIFGKGKR